MGTNKDKSRTSANQSGIDLDLEIQYPDIRIRSLISLFCCCYFFQSGALCIHDAARKGHVGLLKMLLEKGVSVNAKDKVKRTDNLFLSRVGFHLTPTEYLREDDNCSTSYTHSYDGNIIV